VEVRLSRRTLMRSSALAAVAGCLPAIAWSKEKKGSRARIVDFLDALRLSRMYTIEVAQAMPEEKYNFRPVPEVRSYAQQLLHIAESLPGLFEIFIEGKKAPTHSFSEAGKEEFKSKVDVLARLTEAYDYVDKASAALTDDKLDQSTKYFRRDVLRSRVLHNILDHTTHHRAQCVVYLRLNGIKPPDYRA
jgi:uncharacterized damage-inducible protein DinB